MTRGECPNPQPDCKYYPDCFSDTDHIYGRARGGIRKDFTELAVNKRQICRREHDEINATYVHLPLPDIDTMKEIIEREKHERSED